MRYTKIRNSVMKKGAKWILQMCFMSTLLTGVAVYAAEQDDTQTIEVKMNIQEEEMEPYIAAFETKYPDINIDYECISDYEEEMEKRFATGDYGDVLFFPAFVWQKDYATYFAPLGNYDELKQKYDYLESAKSVNKLVYGLPSSAYMMGILYNKDVFYQAGVTIPKTTEEFLEALRNIKDRTDAIPFYTNYADTWALTYWEYFSYIEMTGNPYYKEIEFMDEQNPFLEDTTHYTVYKLLYDIVDQDLCEEDPKQTSWQESKRMLNEGEIGCLVIGSWAITQFKNAGEYPDSIGFMPFPNEIAGRQYMTIAADYSYAINVNSQKKEAAQTFISFMLDESGFALDHETLSIVRTDPYPDSYGNMENVILMSNSVATAESYAKKLILSENLSLENGEGAKRVIEAAAGIRKENFDDVMTDWNTRWESQRTPEMQQTLSTTNQVGYNMIAEHYEVNFSQTEMEYLRSNEGIQVGYLKNRAPFQYEDDGEFSGVAADICEIIQHNTGLVMQFHAYENVQELWYAIDSGEIDMLAGFNSVAGDWGLKTSKKYIDYVNVMVKNTSVDAEQIEDAKRAEINTVQNPIADGYDTLQDAIEAVEKQEADYLITNFLSANYYIKKLECQNVELIPMTEYGTICFAFSQEMDSRLISICNKCLYGIQEENIQVMMVEHMDPPEPKITVAYFIKENSMAFLLMVCVIFVVILVQAAVVMWEKDKSAKKHELDVKRYEVLAAMVDEYIFEYDSSTKTIHFDQKFHDKFGFAEEEQLTDGGLSDDGLLKSMIERYKVALRHKEKMTEPFQVTDLQGITQWYRLFANTVCDKSGKPQHVIGKLVNISKDMQEKQKMEEQVMHDSLTGLYNREGFQKIYAEKLENLTADGMVFAVTDIDHFKLVNDALGYTGGDEVLRWFANTLKDQAPTDSILSRYGGGEFILCMPKVSMEQAKEIFTDISKHMNREFVYQSNSKQISISIGAVFTTEKLPCNVIFKEADKVLHKLKEDEKPCFHIISHLDDI